MKRFFQEFRDNRFALPTLQNPDCEVRTYAELVPAAQRDRERQPCACPPQQGSKGVPRQPVPSRAYGTEPALPFSFSLCALRQNLIATQKLDIGAND
jgi:hypothetical protein